MKINATILDLTAKLGELVAEAHDADTTAAAAAEKISVLTANVPLASDLESNELSEARKQIRSAAKVRERLPSKLKETLRPLGEELVKVLEPELQLIREDIGLHILPVCGLSIHEAYRKAAEMPLYREAFTTVQNVHRYFALRADLSSLLDAAGTVSEIVEKLQAGQQVWTIPN